MKTLLLVIGLIGVIVFVGLYIKDNNQKSKKMKIKKEFFNGADNSKILHCLVENCYPPDDDNFNIEKFEKVTQNFVLFVNMDGQILNGGVIQFIDNSTGNYFHETIQVAKAIKSTELLEILTKAAGQFPNGQIPKNWEERRALYDELSDLHSNYIPFHELDSADKEKFLQNFDYSISLDDVVIDVDDGWGSVWDELDKLYYDNSEKIYQALIQYLKNNAELVD
jgi:hypothetical protein